MHRVFWLLACLIPLALVGCTPEYYARRAARREQRLQQRALQEQQHINQMCGDGQYAFELGHNAGLSRQPMDTAWIARCPYQLQAQQRNAYMSGYQQGASYAPQQVVMAAPTTTAVVIGTGNAYAGLASCTFSSDCGPQMNCRQWGGAGSVCMGFGGSGAPCWFGSDCLSGWCDGTSARVCR